MIYRPMRERIRLALLPPGSSEVEDHHADQIEPEESEDWPNVPDRGHALDQVVGPADEKVNPVATSDAEQDTFCSHIANLDAGDSERILIRDPLRFKLGDGSRRTLTLWRGEDIGSCSVDCETEMIDPGCPSKVPELSLAFAANDRHCVTITPDRIADFLEVHHAHHVVTHNGGRFDVAVLQQAAPCARILEAIEAGRWHCTRLLAMLVDIGTDDYVRKSGKAGKPYSLFALSWRFLGYGPSKADKDGDDAVRKRYAELIRSDWEEPIETGFLTYGIADPIYTWQCWKVLSRRAKAIMERHESPRGHGLLTEVLQFKADVALEAMRRRGLDIDRDQVEKTYAELDQDIAKRITILEELAPHPIFHRTKDGAIKHSAKNGDPCFITKKGINPILENIIAKHRIPRQYTPKGNPSYAPKHLAEYKEADPFLEAYVTLKETAKLRGYMKDMRVGRIHPRPTGPKRTGRIGMIAPPIQCFPRSCRPLIMAPAGKLMYTGDLVGIELVTFANVCEQRYGRSVLAETIRAGKDVHATTASYILKMSYEDFRALRETDPDKYKKYRSWAKPSNFGLPTGMSAETLQKSLRSWGVKITIEDAETIRAAIVEAYPEIRQYWACDQLGTLAKNLRCDPDEIVDEGFQETDIQIGMMRRICNGETESSMGREYGDEMIGGVWSLLAECNRNPYFDDLIAAANTERSYRLFNETTTTLSGRVRGMVSYTQARNTPFQGAAADAMKAVAWRLHVEGYELVGVVHDEFLVLVDEDTAQEQQAAIDTLIVNETQAFCGDVPARVESTVQRCWEKP